MQNALSLYGGGHQLQQSIGVTRGLFAPSEPGHWQSVRKSPVRRDLGSWSRIAWLVPVGMNLCQQTLQFFVANEARLGTESSPFLLGAVCGFSVVVVAAFIAYRLTGETMVCKHKPGDSLCKRREPAERIERMKGVGGFRHIKAVANQATASAIKPKRFKRLRLDAVIGGMRKPPEPFAVVGRVADEGLE